MEPFYQDVKIVYPQRIPEMIEEDPDDNQILACASEGKANFIVSGDKHLLDLKDYCDIKIIPPREFIRILG